MHPLSPSSLSSLQVTFSELIKLNIPDWYFVLIGIFMSALFGCILPLTAIFFSETLEVGVAYAGM